LGIAERFPGRQLGRIERNADPRHAASVYTSRKLQEHIDAYVNAYNDKAEPFVRTKKKVRQRRCKGRRITQL